MPSPIPIPTNLKTMRGTARPCRLNDKEPHPEKLESLAPPEELHDSERECWNNVITGLQNAGIATVVDISALTAYCKAWCGWIAEIKIIEKEGSVVTGGTGGPIINPHVRIANDYFKQMLAIWREFGMTPSARSRIHSETDKPDDDYEAWQKKRRMAREGV